MDIKIDKGIPAPKGPNKYPFPDMRVGDSFFAPINPRHSGGLTSNAKRIYPGTGWRSSRVTENGITGVRVWRIK